MKSVSLCGCYLLDLNRDLMYAYFSCRIHFCNKSAIFVIQNWLTPIFGCHSCLFLVFIVFFFTHHRPPPFPPPRWCYAPDAESEDPCGKTPEGSICFCIKPAAEQKMALLRPPAAILSSSFRLLVPFHFIFSKLASNVKLQRVTRTLLCKLMTSVLP